MSKKLPWFRMYTDFLNDPKMISLSFEDQRHFIGILALKCDGAIDDTADGNLLDRIVAQRLWIDHAIIRDVKKRLVSSGLIDEEWQPVAWDRRQMKSDADSTAAERQRRYREANTRNALRNATVTRQELDTETDKESKPSAPASPAADIPDESSKEEKPKASAVTFKTFVATCKASGKNPIPESDPVFDWADGAGVPVDFLRLAWLEFRSRYSDSAKRYRDWRRVFRNAVRDNWFKLWFCNEQGVVCLSNQGRLIQKTHAEAVCN